MLNKQKFISDYNNVVRIKMIVTAIQLPSGSIEIIINNDDLENKYMYIIETYDENMCKYDNENVRIVDWMIL